MSAIVKRFRSGIARVLRGVAYRLHAGLADSATPSPSSDGYDLVPKGQYDYVPKGTYVYGPADRFLLVPKNRYRAALLPNQSITADLGVGWITEDNSAEGYDQLWGNSSNLAAFRAEADHVRDKLTLEVVNHIEALVKPDARVVDIGCGVGDLLGEVRKRRPKVSVSGLDFSGEAVAGAQAAMPDGQFQQFVIQQDLPYTTASFDVVMCTDVLEHLEYPKRIAAELVRICRPGGLVAIVVPDGDVDQFFGHYWFWNEQSLALLLQDWGGQVIRLPETREFLACIAVDHAKRGSNVS